MGNRRDVSGVDQGVAEVAISNAASSTYFDVPASIGRAAFNGELKGVVVRVSTLGSNGAPAEPTLSALRVRVGSLRHCSAITDGDNLPAEARLFDSGALTSPTPSATAACVEESFAGASGDPQPFTDGMRVYLNYTIGAGGDRVVRVALSYDAGES